MSSGEQNKKAKPDTGETSDVGVVVMMMMMMTTIMDPF
jgi:hypothetical protein